MAQNLPLVKQEHFIELLFNLHALGGSFETLCSFFFETLVPITLNEAGNGYIGAFSSSWSCIDFFFSDAAASVIARR